MEAAVPLTQIGAPALIALVLLMLLNGKLILPRELAVARAETERERKEKEEWKRMALRSTDLTERAVGAANRDGDSG